MVKLTETYGKLFQILVKLSDTCRKISSSLWGSNLQGILSEARLHQAFSENLTVQAIKLFQVSGEAVSSLTGCFLKLVGRLYQANVFMFLGEACQTSEKSF